MIVETTNYYPRPGQEAAVIAQRRAASAIRKQLGLAPGQIQIKLEGEGPHVRWQCVFADRDAYDRDMQVRGSSAAFGAARQAMHALIERFERTLYAVDNAQDSLPELDRE